MDKWTRIMKRATAGVLSLALVGITGCNTIEGAGEDLSVVGRSLSSGADRTAEVVNYDQDPHDRQAGDRQYWQPAEQQQAYGMERQDQWYGQARSEPLQAQQHDAGLFTAEGRQISPLDRQQQQAQFNQQAPQQFGFADGQAQMDKQARQVSGEVTEVLRANGQIQQLTLQTADGQKHKVNLQNVQRAIDVEKGDQISIRGHVDDQQVFQASDIRKGADQTFGFEADQQQLDRQQQMQRQRDQQWQPQGQQDQLQQDQQAARIQGTVENIQKDGDQIRHLTVRTDDGQQVKADLTRAADHVQLEEGDKVRLSGQKEGDMLHVNRIQKADEAGVFGFAGEEVQTVRGEVQAIQRLQEEDKGPHLIIRSVDGQTITADLSKLDRNKLLGLNVEQGTQLTLQGHRQQMDGKQVLIVRDIQSQQGQLNQQLQPERQNRLQQELNQQQQRLQNELQEQEQEIQEPALQ